MLTFTNLSKETYQQEKTLILVALCILVFFSLVLRIHHLDFQSLFVDEIRQVSYYKNNFIEIIFNAVSQNQPPLDYWVGHIFYYYSESDFSVRLPSAIFGSLSVLLITLLIKKSCNWPIAIGSGFIYSLLPFSIYFSQEARPYSISIFLFLTVLYQLNYLITSKVFKFKHYILFTVTVSCFLFTRALAPLLIVFSLIIILILFYYYKVFKINYSNPRMKRPVFILLSLVFSLSLYMPLFYIIHKAGSAYATQTIDINTQLLFNGLKEFSINPLWIAFVVQTEPLTWLFLIGAIIGIFLTIYVKEILSNFLTVTVAALLPTVSLLHLLIFQTFTSSIFRPPYAMYLAPLSLILSAITTNKLWEICKNKLSIKYTRILIIIICLILTLSLSITAVDFKNNKIKHDWKDLISYISIDDGESHLYITHNLSKTITWDAGLYGIFRYPYSGNKYIPIELKMMNDYIALSSFHSNWKPFLILSHDRNYFLTSNSRFGIFPKNRPDSIPFTSIQLDPALKFHEVTGFSILSLRTSNGNLISDILSLLDKVAQSIEQDSSAVELYLTLSYFENVCGLETYKEHLQLAEMLSTDIYEHRIAKTKKMMADLKADEVIDCFNTPEEYLLH